MCQRLKSGKRSCMYFDVLDVVIFEFPFPLLCFVSVTNRYNRFASHLTFPDIGKTRNVNCECHVLHFVLALTVFEILTVEIFDLEKLGQGQRGNIRNDTNGKC